MPAKTHVVEIAREAVSGKLARKFGIQGRGETVQPVAPLLCQPIPTCVVDNNGEVAGKDVLEAVRKQCIKQQTHHHMRTCKKGGNGASGCRLCCPCPVLPKTVPVRLRRLHEESRTAQMAHDDGHFVYSYYDWEYEVIPLDHITDQPAAPYGKFSILAPERTDEAVVWELKRPPLAVYNHQWKPPDIILAHVLNPETGENFAPETGNVEIVNRWDIMRWLERNILRQVLTPAARNRWIAEASDKEIYFMFQHIDGRIQHANGYISAYNPLLSLCTGSHNNSQLLGSSYQAKAGMNYICPYMGKRKTPLLHALLILDEVIVNAKKYPTTSTDEPGSPRRNAIFVLEKFLNKVNMQMELSDYQVAAALLDLPPIIKSTQFTYLNPRAAGNFSLWLEKQREMDTQSDADFANDYDVHMEAAIHDSCTTSNNESQQPPGCFLSVDRLAAVEVIDGYADGGGNDEDSSTDGCQANDSVSYAEETSCADDVVPKDDNNDESSDTGESSPRAVESDKYNTIYTGPVKKYTIDEESSVGLVSRQVLVKYASLYCNRGEALRDLSRLEYSALTQITKTNKTSARTARKQNFPLSAIHVLSTSHTQQLAAKQNTVVVCSKAPHHPGQCPEGDDVTPQQLHKWKRKADAFARYVLVLSRPEPDCYSEDQINSYSYDWDTLQQWVTGLANDNTVLSKFRLVALYRRFCELKCSMSNSNMLSHYRKRSRDMWTKEEADEMMRGKSRVWDENQWVEQEQGGDKSNLAEQCTFEAKHARLTDRERKSVNDALYHDAVEQMTHYRCLPPIPDQFHSSAASRTAQPGSVTTVGDIQRSGQSNFSSTDALVNRCGSDSVEYQRFIAEKRCHSKRLRKSDKDDTVVAADWEHDNGLGVGVDKDDDNNKCEDVLDDNSDSDTIDSTAAPDEDTTATAPQLDPHEIMRIKLRTLKKSLNKEQYRIAETYALFFMDQDEGETPPITFCSGMGGTGKTTLVVAMEGLARVFGGRVVKTSFNNINVVAFNDADTTTKMFNLHAESDVKSVSGLPVHELTKTLLKKNTKLLVVDECGNQPTWAIAKIIHVVQEQLKTAGHPMIPILFVGDPSQLGPVKAGLPFWRLGMELLLKQHSPFVTALKEQIAEAEGLQRRPKKRRRIFGSGSTSKQIRGRPAASAQSRTTSFTANVREEVVKASGTIDDPRRIGATRMLEATFTELTEQMRSEDHSHTDRICHMHKGGPISGKEINNSYKSLASDDFLDCDHTGNFNVIQRSLWIDRQLQKHNFSLDDSDFTHASLLAKTRGFQETDYIHLFEGIRSYLGIETSDVRHSPTARATTITLEVFMYARNHSCQPWFEVPIITPTHRSRMTITHTSAVNYGATVGVPVVRWRKEEDRWEQKPGPGSVANCISNDPCFHQYFLTGAEGCLTSTVSKKLKLVNAQKFLFHSFCMATAEKQEAANQQMYAAAPGDVVDLEEPPLFVNIALHPDDLGENTVEIIRKRLGDNSTFETDSGYIVLPIFPDKSVNDWHRVAVRGCPHGTFQPSRVAVRSVFPVALMLTMTVNRAQGQTLRRVIIALAHNPSFPLTYAHIYVALSRVRKAKDIRLLIAGGTPVAKMGRLDYIDKLRPDLSVLALLHGFREGVKECKRRGLPWTKAKLCETSAVRRLVLLEHDYTKWYTAQTN